MSAKTVPCFKGATFSKYDGGKSLWGSPTDRMRVGNHSVAVVKMDRPGKSLGWLQSFFYFEVQVESPTGSVETVYVNKMSAAKRLVSWESSFPSFFESVDKWSQAFFGSQCVQDDADAYKAVCGVFRCKEKTLHQEEWNAITQLCGAPWSTYST